MGAYMRKPGLEPGFLVVYESKNRSGYSLNMDLMPPQVVLSVPTEQSVIVSVTLVKSQHAPREYVGLQLGSRKPG